MNTGAIITAVGGVLTAVLTILVGWFVRRTDRVAKMTQANMEDQHYILVLVGALRDDYWSLADWAYHARFQYNQSRSKLTAHGEESKPLPRFPHPKHRDMEARHAKGEPVDGDDD